MAPSATLLQRSHGLWRGGSKVHECLVMRAHQGGPEAGDVLSRANAYREVGLVRSLMPSLVAR